MRKNQSDWCCQYPQNVAQNKKLGCSKKNFQNLSQYRPLKANAKEISVTGVASILKMWPKIRN